MKSSWKQVRYRLEYFGCRLLAGLVPLLPRRACLILAHASGALYYRFDRKTRAVALENLRLTLGADLDAPARERIARASFLNVARAMLDLFWARNLTPENFRSYLKTVNFHHAHAVKAEYGSVIVIAMHYGGQEWAHMAPGFEGFEMSYVALDFKNTALESVFRTAREHSGNLILGQHQSMLKLLRAVRRGSGGGLMVDLPLRLEHPGVPIEMLGLKIYATCLHAVLHSRTGVPIVPLTSIPHPDGTCTVTAHPALVFPKDASLQAITQGCWDFFEPFVRERPDLWLWNYRYWRYQPKDDIREYPSYSHVAKKFDQAIAAAEMRPTVDAQKAVGN